MSAVDFEAVTYTQKRGNFHQRYALDKAHRAMNAPGWRLLDCLLCVAPKDDPDFLDDPAAGEFAVVDAKTQEKAWFEMPQGCTPDVVQGMVESHFAACAVRVAQKVWVV